MERDNFTLTIRRKIEDIQTLIKNSHKDSALRQQLDAQFTNILQEQQKLKKEINKEKLIPLFSRLTTFKSYIINQLSKSAVIRNPTVTLARIGTQHLAQNNAQMSLDQNRLTSQERNGGGSTDSEDEEELFEEVTNGNNSSVNGKNGYTPSLLPEKRVRKQVVRPDFVSTFKKIKMEKMEFKEEEEVEELQDEQEANSSNEGATSPTPSSNGGFSNEFPCPVCKKIFRKKGHMTRHLLTHEPEKPFGCDMCPKRFAAKYSLQMHLLNRHNTDAKPFVCGHGNCDKRFTLKKELDQHTATHKEGFKARSYPCHLCLLKFITHLDLDTHLESHPEANIYHCGHCDKSFPRKYNLTRHERTHSTDKPYHCSKCNKDFGTKNGLHMHLQAHEAAEDYKPLSCHLCSKKFTVEQNLELHIAFHNQSDEKPFGCNLCEVRFKSQERLDKHFETHGSSEGRIYPCSYCEKSFPRKYNLIRHELSHTHGRRKPKDGMPMKIHNDTAGDDGESEDENISSSVDKTKCTADDNSVYSQDSESMQESSRYNFVYSSISKSDLFTTFFGFEDRDHDGPPPFASENYSVLKFENY